MLAQLLEDYPEDVRIIYRHFPLTSIHDKAALATQISEAAGLQGKFWEMHDLIFSLRDKWNEMTEDEFKEWAIDQSDKLGLDSEQFAEDIDSEELVALAQDAWEHNSSVGMPGTPFLVINGRPYNGPLDRGNLEAIVTTVTLEKDQFSECPPMEIDPDKQYIVTLHTEKGDITMEMYASTAPLAVNSFVFLAENGWFDDVTFHRVIPGFVAQAGDPSGTGFGGPGYAFDNEISPDHQFDSAGVVGMANAGPGSNGSQFFITYAATPNLDGGYTIFGRVIDGMDVVESLTPRDPTQSMDLPPGDKILGVTVEER